MPSSPFEQPGGVGECIPRASVSIPTKGSCNPSEPDPISPPLHKMGGEMVDPQGRYPAPGTSSCAPGGPSYSTFGYESRGRGYPPLPAWAFNPGAGRQRQRKGEPENISYLYRRDGRGAENLPPVQKGGKTAKSGRISRISRKIPRRISRMRAPPPTPGKFHGNLDAASNFPGNFPGDPPGNFPRMRLRRSSPRGISRGSFPGNRPPQIAGAPR